MKISVLSFSTLRFKIAALIIALLLVTASIFSILTVQIMNRRILDEVVKRAVSLCRNTAVLAPYSMLSGDALGVDNIVSKVMEANADVLLVAVTDPGFKILAHSDISKRDSLFMMSPGDIIRDDDVVRVTDVREPAGGRLELHAPVLFRGKLLGHVFIGIDKSALTAAKAETRKRILAGLLIVLCLGGGCIIVLSSFVTKPIKELSMGVDKLKRGRQSPLRIYSHDELGSLTASFNQMAELITRQQEELGVSARELEEAYVSTVKVLSAAIDARDPYTLGHSTRVAKLSVKIGEALGFTHRELEDLEVASLFHDVGKLKTPDHVLLKDGSLNPVEHHEMAEHTEHGAAILSRAKSLQKYVPAVRHHHEWFNGEGYPDGLRSEDIPLHASIITVADSFDAMTSSRPYKKPRSPEDALRELARFAGKQFDPRIVEVFISVIEAEPALVELNSGRK
jgi:putative nucleotidyltransferase with HDIG domain